MVEMKLKTLRVWTYSDLTGACGKLYNDIHVHADTNSLMVCAKLLFLLVAS